MTNAQPCQSKEIRIFEPAHEANKLFCCCNSQDHQDCITTSFSIAETSFLNEIKKLHKIIKGKDNIITDQCSKIIDKDNVRCLSVRLELDVLQRKFTHFLCCQISLNC